jgi:hypothetical protein
MIEWIEWNNWINAASSIGTIDKELDQVLFEFIRSERLLINIPYLSNYERKYLHMRCDQLNLFHNSFDDCENRVLNMEKPLFWSLTDPLPLKEFFFIPRITVQGNLCVRTVR